MFDGFARLDKELVQVVVPGSTVLKFDRPGTKTMFLETNSVVRGKIYSTNSSISGLECHVFASADHVELPIRRTRTTFTYTLNGRSGTSIEEFTVSSAGSYELQCGYEQSRDGPEVVLAVGAFDLDFAFRPIPFIFLSIGIGILVGAVIFVIIYRLQRRNLVVASKREGDPQFPS